MEISHIVVGLGNPGAEYLRSPHNAGFDAVSDLRAILKAPKFSKDGDALVSLKAVRGEGVLMVLPQTYMNRSGESVARVLRKHDLPASRLIICYDDLDLPCGSVRLRPHGGAGGHHGMESIIGEIGTSMFPRVRIGVGDEAVARDGTVDYLLTPLPEERYSELLASARRAAAAVMDALFMGWHKAMNIHNRKETVSEEERTEDDNG